MMLHCCDFLSGLLICGFISKISTWTNLAWWKYQSALVWERGRAFLLTAEWLRCRFRHWTWCGCVRWMQNEVWDGQKDLWGEELGVKRHRWEYLATSSEVPPILEGCLCCWIEFAVRFKESSFTLWLRPLQGIKNEVSASCCPEMYPSVYKNKTRADDFSICIECFIMRRITLLKTLENVNDVLWIGKWSLGNNVCCWITFVP